MLTSRGHSWPIRLAVGVGDPQRQCHMEGSHSKADRA
jgi:hypothetical protein